MEQLLRSLQDATVHDLAVPVSHRLPVFHSHVPYSLALAKRHGDVRGREFSSASEIIVMSGHTGTHVDAPGHISRQMTLYGGLSAHDVQGSRGLRALGVETVAPVLGRGVLLDLPALHGVDVLPPEHAAGPAELAAAAARQGVAIRPGDAVLIRTGWIRHLADPAVLGGLEHGAPGPTAAAARWLAEQGIAVTGADNVVYEHYQPQMAEFEAHMALLTDRGIPIIEMLDLEALSTNHTYEFLFICSPLKLVGATGSPVRPLAVVPGGR